MLNSFPRLFERFQWFIHDKMGKPLAEILFQLGYFKLAGRISIAFVPVAHKKRISQTLKSVDREKNLW